MKTQKIGFIGGGNMASSLMNGLIASGHAPGCLWVSDINPGVLSALSDTLKVNTTASNTDLVQAVDVVVLAIKPQQLRRVAEDVSALIQQNCRLVVSIAAGVRQQSLSQWLGTGVAVVRCMPNTPALVLTGATALHANAHVTEAQMDLAENIMRAVGISLWVQDETDLDTVTAVSGSGPAYYFLLMEAMEKSAQALGLSEATARLLVQQTALGAAKIALESPNSPQQLRQQVTSAGGTTQQAIAVFEQGNFSGLVDQALRAARNRSIELSRHSEDK